MPQKSEKNCDEIEFAVFPCVLAPAGDRTISITPEPSPRAAVFIAENIQNIEIPDEANNRETIERILDRVDGGLLYLLSTANGFPSSLTATEIMWIWINWEAVQEQHPITSWAKSWDRFVVEYLPRRKTWE